MDERELAEMFQAAGLPTPPASFDQHDVARAARRVTVRRRLVAIGTATAALLVACGVGVGLFTARTPPEASVPQILPSSASPDVGPNVGVRSLGPRTLIAPGCPAPDPQLALALAQQLPVAYGQSPVPARNGCAPGARNAAFLLHDGTAAGEVMAIISPPGAPQAPPRSGGQQVTSTARSGTVLTVESDPDPGSPRPPFASDLDVIAGRLAARF